MPERWELDGDWINSCSCDSGCPCLFYSDPTKGHCDGMDGFHIRKGKYGNVSLDGLNAVIASHSPGNFWKGNWSAALYLDNKATKEQQMALETIFGGKAGGAPAMLAGLITDLKGMKWAPIEIDANKIWVKVSGVLEYQLKPTEGGDKKKAIQVANHPLSPAVDAMSMGVGVMSHFKDYGMEWDNTGKDGNYAAFHFNGP
ncbi:MAG: DUF1326 domain-containing protein [Thaumarchaeota archaeon]|nr:DUF1326 domain-containing protein [Nitrososphaerota archaeon]